MSPIQVTDAAYHSRILGLGGYRPERVVTNEEICQHIESTDEWIRERSGIVERRFAAPDESVVDMAERAARDACAMAGVAPQDIDYVLVASVTHPFQLPAVAALLADRLGTRNAPAIDLSAACAGYCYGIGLASDLVRSGSAANVLVVGSEKLTDFIDHEDRSIAFIFGDGAGAAVVGRSDTPGIGPTVWGSDGSQAHVIRQHQSWLDVRTGLMGDDDSVAQGHTFTMEGPSVFRWAVWTMAPVVREALDRAGLTTDDLDVFIPHQANLRIIDQMVKTLKLPERVVVAKDIIDSGNTSSASVPMAATRVLAEQRAESGALAVQFGFGAGLVWAAQAIELP